MLHLPSGSNSVLHNISYLCHTETSSHLSDSTGLFPTKRYFGPSQFRKMWSVNVSIEFQPKDCKNYQEYDEFDQRYHDQHE